MAQLRIFLSHSSADRDFADTLARALRGAGADVWYDETHLGTGQLLDEISAQLPTRPVFLLVASKAAFASDWVKQECKWAFNLYRREPNRIMLPIVAKQLDPADWNAMLWLEDFRRIEAPGDKPYPQHEAIEHTLRLLALTPAGEAPAPVAPQPTESVDDLLTRGRALRQQGKHAEALALFERATQLAPNSYDAWFNVAYSLDDLGRYEKALVAYDRAISLNRSDYVVWYNKGISFSNLERYSEALSVYEQALTLDARDVDVWNNKGNALKGLQRYTEALVAYEQALALDPKYALAWNGKGSALQGLQRYAEALSAYEQALTLDLKLKEAWHNKGTVLYSLKRYDEEIAAYQQALTIDPNYALAWKNMAITLRLLGRVKEAEEAEARAKALGG
ncbi:MAG TPA: toll/interleukin-1 receptor domain-containing protein [Ktedonobacterales bacterium]|jgi:tetratricopeptide (TPR) repeat protein